MSFTEPQVSFGKMRAFPISLKILMIMKDHNEELITRN